MDLFEEPNEKQDRRASKGVSDERPTQMRRQDLVMNEARAQALLKQAFCGRLATIGMDGAPYCTTMLYVRMDGRSPMHGARTRGHLRSNIDHEPRACLAIDEPGSVFDYNHFECDSSMSHASVLVFGRVRIVEEGAAKQRFFDALMAKYRTAEATRPKAFYPLIDQIILYELEIERLTGKEIVLPDISGQWPALDRTKTPNARPPGS
jgi:nitroimidazol reductase NimA-like FMN-containing flavoprotein (pyridoxamine 5'-phosphate oxidase superfamily)